MCIRDREYQYIASRGLTLVQRARPGITESLYPNVNNGRPFSDPLVREAFQKAIDRKSYASTFFGNHYPVAEGVIEPSTLYYKSQAQNLQHDPQAANALLEKAGWKLREDGYRYKNDEKLTVVYPVVDGKAGDILVQDQVKKVGFNMVLLPVTAGDASNRFIAGDYDLSRGVLSRGDPVVIQSHSDVRYSGSAIARNRFTPEVQAQLQVLLDRGAAEPDTAIRRGFYEEVQDLILSENGFFPVYARAQHGAIGKQVHGYKLTGDAFLNVNDIWISK